MTAWIANADVITWLGPQVDDTTAGILAQAASDSVMALIERDLALQSGLTEYYDSNGTDYILLNSWPVRSVTSVTILNWPNGGTIPAAAPGTPGYQVDRFNERKLRFTGMGKIPRAQMNITVVYSAGYDLTVAAGTPPGLPADVYLALKLTTNAIYNAQAADTNIASETTAGVFSGSYYPSGAGAVPPGAQTLLRRYMRTAP